MRREIQNIHNELSDGYRIQRRFSRFGRFYKIPLTKGRRRMLELRLRQLEDHSCMRWTSVEPVLEWDATKGKHEFKRFRYVRGTYCRAKHGSLYDPRPMTEAERKTLDAKAI